MTDSAELTQELVFQTIDSICDEYNRISSKWSVTRSSITDDLDATGKELLYGIEAKSKDSTLDSASILTSFYFAYSTWDGRIVYLDDRYRGDDQELKLVLRWLLAKIAIPLKCKRLTWQHYDEDSGEFTYPQSNIPETLHGWLTLHWKSENFQTFLKGHGLEIGTVKDADASLEDVVHGALKAVSHDKFQLRLASESDLPHICRLVQGLADFEKESDAVHVTMEDYRLDGFRSKRLFRCLLMDHINEKQEAYTCGMAFHYLGYTKKDGLFLYLEDLFIEEEYRKGGGGTLMMKALASIGNSLQCSRLVWQALDWNTPALTFYGKLGATVQDGLLTTRYMDETLNEFCSAVATDSTS